MGASQSSSSLSIADTVTASVITQNVLNCSQSSSATQTTVFSGGSMFDSVSQSVNISQACLQNIKVSDTDATTIANQIQQQAAANAQALLPAFAGSSNVENLKTAITTNINTQNFVNGVQQAVANQSTTFLGLSFGDSATQSQTALQKAIQTAVANTNLTNTIMDTTKQDDNSTASGNPFALTDTDLYIVAIIIIGIVIIAILPSILKMASGGGNKTVDANTTTTQQAITPAPIKT
ncbi:unnamed protein product [Sphagnum jensenii]|uniref:Lipid membrane protein n=1 Tax=Sphagnum jensenii TaxID=128206 RepID=A0ABP0VCM6_9BRYO